MAYTCVYPPVCIPCDAYFLGPTQIHILNSTLISSAVFAQLMAELLYKLYFTTGCIFFPLKLSLLRGRSEP